MQTELQFFFSCAATFVQCVDTWGGRPQHVPTSIHECRLLIYRHAEPTEGLGQLLAGGSDRRQGPTHAIHSVYLYHLQSGRPQGLQGSPQTGYAPWKPKLQEVQEHKSQIDAVLNVGSENHASEYAGGDGTDQPIELGLIERRPPPPEEEASSVGPTPQEADGDLEGQQGASGGLVEVLGRGLPFYSMMTH